jgi:hypothetical protein
MIVVSRRNAEPATWIGHTRAVTPTINKTLAMFDPTMLPIAISGTPFNAACTDTKSSGVNVPKPTTVKPMMNGEIDILCAMLTLPRTRASPPRNRPTKPAMIDK